MSRTAMLGIAAAAALVLAVVAGILLFTGPRDGGAGATRVTGSALVGGPFTLTDQFGKTRSDADFRGKLLLVFFGYTYCPDFCPTALHTMSEALDMLGPDAEKIQPLFITVDPARDTVEQLRLYAENFHPSLIALTGTPEQVAVAAKAYRVYYAKAAGNEGDDYLMDHSTFVYLMGPDGAYLTHFRHGMAAPELAAALRKYL